MPELEQKTHNRLYRYRVVIGGFIVAVVWLAWL